MPTVNTERLNQLIAALGGTSIVLVQGDTTLPISGNQRTTAVTMHLFDAPKPVSEVAVLVSPTALTLCGKQATFAGAGTGVPVNAVDAAGFAAAVAAAGPIAIVKAELSPQIQLGDWAASIISSLEASVANAADAAPLIAAGLAVCDKSAQLAIAKAGAVAANAFKRFGLPYLQKELSSGNPVSQAAAANEFTNICNHPDQMEGLEDMDPEGFAAAFDANVQCGPDSYDLRLINPVMSSQPLVGPVLNVAVGAKFNGFTSYCARTVFVDPVVDRLREAYEFMLAVQENAMKLLVPGKALKEVHAETLAFAQLKSATLAAQLGADFGFSTGLHFMDKNASIGPKATLNVKEGAAFAVRITLNDVVVPVVVKAEVKAENGEDAPADAAVPTERKVSLILGDTVVVGEKGADFKTKAKRGLDDVRFAVKLKKKYDLDALPEPRERFTRGAAATAGLQMEESRQELQKAIFKKKREEWIAAGSPRGVQSGSSTRPEDFTASGKLARGALTTYPQGVPAEFNGKGICVDRARQALLLPIGGVTVPFHIATVSKLEVRADASGKHAMTVTFATTQQSNVAYARHRNRQWVKELTYVREEGGPLYAAQAAVKEVQAALKAADAKNKTESGVAADVKIKLKANAPRLPSVKVRPAPAGRGVKGATVGNLDLHDNGLRFSFAGGHIDVPFSNIKHLIFQPARKDVSVILHCHLRQPMKIDGVAKPTADVQFYVEVVETSEAASNVRRTHEEEVEAEDRDKERIKKTEQQFAGFARRVTEIASAAGDSLTVLAPFRELDFDAVGNKRMTRFRACEHALWAISELPFTVVSVEDVEVVSLERVLPGQATFDMMFIMSDYKTVQQVTTVPMTKLEAIKDWMNAAGLLYFEGTNNVAWPRLLKEMKDDPEWEAWGTEGWIQYIDPNHDAEEGGEDDSSLDPDDSDFDPDSSDEEDDEDDDSGSSWAEEGSSSGFASDSDDEEDDDFDSDDDAGGYSESDDSDDRRKRGRGGAKGAVPQRRPPQPGRR